MPKEYIDKLALLSTYEMQNYPWVDTEDMFEIAQNFPTADVAEVVRCKDCKFHTDEEPGMVYCPAILGNWVNDDWFCKDGERRTE